MKNNNNLKILLVSPSPLPVGGIQSWTVNLLDYLKHQDQLDYCYVDTTVKYKDILEMGFYKRINAGIRVTIDVIRAIKHTIRIHNPNVIHLTSSASLALLKDYFILRAAKKFKIPVIIHWRFGRIPELMIKKNWEWYLLTLVIRKSAFSVVIDNPSYKALLKAGFLNVDYVANPVSTELSIIANRQKNIKRNIVKGKIVFVGHIHSKKGVYELVKACTSSIKVKQLKLIGPVQDNVKADLQNIAQSRGESSWLEFTGVRSRNEVLSEIGSSELLVLPSYTEGFPNAILEAMAMACPVVATNVGAIPEMLNINGDFPAGICVPSKDSPALQESIEKLLLDKELAIRLGENGLNRVLNNFTLEKIFKEYQIIWQTVAARNQY